MPIYEFEQQVIRDLNELIEIGNRTRDLISSIPGVEGSSPSPAPGTVHNHDLTIQAS
jgi:hypothetical protein